MDQMTHLTKNYNRITYCYRIANLNVEMSTFGRTLRQSYPYMFEKCQSNITITGNIKLLRDKQPHLSYDDCEYISTGASFGRQLLHFDGLVLHASAVVMDGYAYLFSAKSGTGKSTHTKLWLECFGERAFILNDDKPALRLENGVWYAYGTPWSGKHDLSVNARVPVAGICMIHRSEKNKIQLFSGPKAIFDLLEQTLRPADPELRAKLMELLDKLMTMVPIWQMGCNMDPEAALVSYEAMSRERKDDR